MQCGHGGYKTRRRFSGETSELLPLPRATSLPNVRRGGNSGGALSSLNISTRDVTEPRSSGSYRCEFAARRPVRPLTSPATTTTTRPPESSRSGHLTSTCCLTRASSRGCQPELCSRGPSVGWEVPDNQALQDFAAGNQDVRRDALRPPPPPSLLLHCSWVHLRLPLRSSFSVVFWEKPLCVPLEGPESRRTPQPCLQRSTCSLRLGASPPQRPSRDREAATETASRGGVGVRGRFKPTPTSGHKYSLPGCGLFTPGDPRPKQQQAPRMAESPTFTAHSVDDKVNDLGTLPGTLAFRGTSRRPKQERKGNGEVDGRGCSSQNKVELRRAFSAGPGSSGAAEARLHQPLPGEAEEPRAESVEAKEEKEEEEDEEDEEQQQAAAAQQQGPWTARPWPPAWPLLAPSRALLAPSKALLAPSRVPVGPQQGPVGPQQGPPAGAPVGPASRPLNNLPTSPTMYNKLPEVTQRREEERRKEASQSNRLRAELFKKVK
ncbi:hypothetical protein CRUP_030811 [Coryphaenoides rupestris]|nr:hypothetical protein CRUP_030811 [Coryphaenoides rupestris]